MNKTRALGIVVSRARLGRPWKIFYCSLVEAGLERRVTDLCASASRTIQNSQPKVSTARRPSVAQCR